jgi:large subunit ribosomal protein L25
MQEKLVVYPREGKGKEYCRKLRREGKVPAVIYGHGFEPMPVSLVEKEFRALLRRERGIHGLLSLRVEGDGEHMVLIKEIQKDPIKDHLLHVDFQRVKADEAISAVVPLKLVGEPRGVRVGGLLQHFLYEVQIQCLPKDLPDEIVVDISRLNVKESLRVGDLPRLEGIRYLNSPEEVVVSITPKRVRAGVRAVVELEEETEEAAAEGQAAEETPEGETGEAGESGEA